jgi:hypothetical protein
MWLSKVKYPNQAFDYKRLWRKGVINHGLDVMNGRQIRRGPTLMPASESLVLIWDRS